MLDGKHILNRPSRPGDSERIVSETPRRVFPWHLLVAGGVGVALILGTVWQNAGWPEWLGTQSNRYREMAQVGSHPSQHLTSAGVATVPAGSYRGGPAQGGSAKQSPSRFIGRSTGRSAAGDADDSEVPNHLAGRLGRHTDSLSDKISILDSPAMIEGKRRQMLERDLSDAIRQMQVIEDAAVTIQELDVRGISPKRMVSAMVILKSRQGEPIGYNWLQSIRMLVAGADVELQEDNVRIVDLTTGRAYAALEEDEAGRQEWDRLDRRRVQEGYWEQKIRRVLDALGEDFDVTVNVKLAEADGTLPNNTMAADRDVQAIGVCLVLHRAPIELQDEAGRREQYQQLRSTLQSLDARLQVTIFEVPRNTAVAMAGNGESNRLAFLSSTRNRTALVVIGGSLLLVMLWIIVVPARDVRRTGAQVPVDVDDSMERNSDARPDDAADAPHDEQDLVLRVGTLVRDDPDAAAKIIQDWMRKAG